MKKALITGCNGQDGSYLSELLLSKDYQVFGMTRRSSVDTTERIKHLLDNDHFHLVEGDVIDATGVFCLVDDIHPDEIYNLAAQSHVATSFSQPSATFEINAIGPLNFLEAIKQRSPLTKFYQASTSELFGDTKESPQNEKTPFKPDSPYAVAKLAAHNLVRLYRQSYGIFASAGILFNHECVSATLTPVMVRQNGLIDILPVGELCTYKEGYVRPQLTIPKNLEIWDITGWTKIKALTVTKRRKDDLDHRMICVNSRGGSFIATAHHKALNSDEEEIRVDSIVSGDRVSLCDDYPEIGQEMFVSDIEAEFLGYMVADGYVSKDAHHVQFTKNDQTLRDRVNTLWRLLTGGTTRTEEGLSGFDGISTQLHLNGADTTFKQQLRNYLYTADSFKRVPKRVLNCPSCWKAFIDAYYAGDGLKSDITRCQYKYQSFKTNSSTLAAGIIFIIHSVTGQTFNINTYFDGDVLTYHVNFRSPNLSNKGAHFVKPINEVTKCLSVNGIDFVVDIETESGTFNCGVGLSHIHNSPRRGENFVTRKITKYVGELAYAISKRVEIPKLLLGNLDSKRDWGHARDYVEAMWMMLQHDTPDDFVIATGRTHSIRDFLDMAFTRIGIDNWSEYVLESSQFKRPSDVCLLQGDASKARIELEWTPKVNLCQLVDEMVEADCAIMGVSI